MSIHELIEQANLILKGKNEEPASVFAMAKQLADVGKSSVKN